MKDYMCWTETSIHGEIADVDQFCLRSLSIKFGDRVHQNRPIVSQINTNQLNGYVRACAFQQSQQYEECCAKEEREVNKLF